ncbi:uncharacterized protein G2W53_000381 [Senna tora]|uniref:Uncharacterized protein n=1 Tax=Senna tora TaxID=362788 RepID=A0A835CHL6_9FABA|nr:uncharacterized protein G2W53_000381 [Senna tora]
MAFRNSASKGQESGPQHSRESRPHSLSKSFTPQTV